jgi:hypothetical protein
MMKSCEIAESYSGRSNGFVPVNRSMEREAVELMMKFAPGVKAQGRFLSRLVYEHAARLEAQKTERQRVSTQLIEALQAEVEEGSIHA